MTSCSLFAFHSRKNAIGTKRVHFPIGILYLYHCMSLFVTLSILCIVSPTRHLDQFVVCSETKSFGYLSSHYDLIVFVFNNVIATTYLHSNVCLTNTNGCTGTFQKNITTKCISHCYYVNVVWLLSTSTLTSCVTFLNETNTFSFRLALLYAQHSMRRFPYNVFRMKISTCFLLCLLLYESVAECRLCC